MNGTVEGRLQYHTRTWPAEQTMMPPYKCWLFAMEMIVVPCQTQLHQLVPHH